MDPFWSCISNLNIGIFQPAMLWNAEPIMHGTKNMQKFTSYLLPKKMMKVRISFVRMFYLECAIVLKHHKMIQRTRPDFIKYTNPCDFTPPCSCIPSGPQWHPTAPEETSTWLWKSCRKLWLPISRKVLKITVKRLMWGIWTLKKEKMKSRKKWWVPPKRI